MTTMKRAMGVVLIQGESGQDLTEYALVAGLVGLGSFLAMSGFTGPIGDAFNSVANSLINFAW
ncbi:MAG: Flp family type IVb pilin [Acidobacteriaceae bacterium]|jgi:pilus assembly protein Flp/PilA